MALLQIFKSSPAPRTADHKMKFIIHRGTADRVAANLTLSEWPGIVKLLPIKPTGVKIYVNVLKWLQWRILPESL